MFINEKLDNLYRQKDYAIWQKESLRGSDDYKKANKLVQFYEREIQKLSHKKLIIKQLTLF